MPHVLAHHDLPSTTALTLVRAICAAGLVVVVLRGWWVDRFPTSHRRKKPPW